MSNNIMPERIGDVEVVPHSLSTHVNCIGTSKYNRDVLIRFRHSHYTNPIGIGECDVILTQAQLVELINACDKALHMLIRYKDVSIHDVTPGSL